MRRNEREIEKTLVARSGQYSAVLIAPLYPAFASRYNEQNTLQT